MPHRRRQAVQKCFGCDRSHQTGDLVVAIGLPAFRIPELVWRVEDRSTSRWDSNCWPPHRYLCVRYWKPHVLRLSSALNSVMAIWE